MLLRSISGHGSCCDVPVCTDQSAPVHRPTVAETDSRDAQKRTDYPLLLRCDRDTYRSTDLKPKRVANFVLF